MIQESLKKIEQVGTQLNPFPGLRPFELHESYLFFGRDGQSEQLIAKLGRTRFLAVVGTSGSGKSSLVRAGLLPSLLTGFMTSAGSNWRAAIMRPGNDPIGNLARELAEPEVFGSGQRDNRSIQSAMIEAGLRRGSRGLVDVVTQNSMPANENLLVLVDQFEEIFRFAGTNVDSRYEDDAAAFVKLLLEASRQREVNIFALLTMRSDYLGDCSRFQGLPEAINEAEYLIPRLTREERREAIEGPVAVAEATISPRLVSRLLNDAGDNPDQLPIMQHALMRAWDEWKNKSSKHAAVHETEQIDLCCYEVIGGMTEALSRHADEAFEELPDARSREIAEGLFKSLTERIDDSREIRRPVTLRDACDIVGASKEEIASVIESFRKPGRAFLMPPADTELTDESMIDISHESLIRNWKRLRDWVEEEARSARIYRRLANTAELYREGGTDLLPATELQLAVEWRNQNKPKAKWGERYHRDFDSAMQFLEKSKAVNEVAIKKEKERQQRELRNVRGFAGILLLAVLLSAAFAIYSYRAKLEAQRLRKAAEITTYIATINLASAELERGNQEGLFALLDDYLESDLRSFAWYYLWGQGVPRRTLPNTGFSNQVAFSPDGRTLAKSGGGSIELWDGEGTRGLATLPGNQCEMFSNPFSPDGRMLAYVCADKIKLWDVLGNREFDTLPIGWGVRSTVFSPDNRMLAYNSQDTIKLWDVHGKREFTLPRDPDGVFSIAFSPDGRTLASASGNRTIKLWDVEEKRELAPPLEGANGVTSIVFSPDGQILVSAGDSIKLWDMLEKREYSLDKHTERVRSVAISRDGRILASASEDKTIKLWDLQGMRELATLTGHAGDVYSVAFSPDGRTLASSGGAVKLWDVKARRAFPLTAHSGGVKSVRFSPDGRILASAGYLWDVKSNRELATPTGFEGTFPMADGRIPPIAGYSIKLWDVQSNRELATPTRFAGTFPMAFAFLPDGRLAIANPLSIEFWDVHEKREPSNLPEAVTSIDVSPDGRTIASATVEHTIKLWEVQGMRELATLPRDPDGINSIAFSHDGRTLATATSKGINLWDVPGKRKLVTIPAGAATGISFSPDGRTLAIAGAEIKLWDVQKNREFAIFTGHQGMVTSIAFARDGRTLASASEDKTIKLWDLQGMRELATLTGHLDKVNAIAFSPDGWSLASGSADGNIRLWIGASSEGVSTWKNQRAH